MRPIARAGLPSGNRFEPGGCGHREDSVMSGRSPEWPETLGRDGFTIVDRVLPSDRVAELIEASEGWSVVGREGVLDRRGETYGVRDLLWRSPEVRLLAGAPELMKLVEPVLGGGAFAVRGLYFD